MIKITDEILNKYLDGELIREEIQEIDQLVNASPDLQKRFNALKLVHKKLSDLKVDEVSAGFTETLMKQITKKKFVIPKQQKYFIASVATFITILCLVIFGFSISAVISSTPSSIADSGSVFDSIPNLSEGIITTLKQLFSGTGLSIIGSVFSIIVLISGYFFFEMQKRSKANLSNNNFV